MRRFFVELGSSHFHAVFAVAIAAVCLAIGIFVRSEWSSDFREHSAASVKPFSDSGRGGPTNSPDPDRLSQVADRVLSLALPGATAPAKDLQLLASQLLDTSHSLKVRRQAAWNLAKLSSPDVISVLRKALVNAPAQLQAAIAEVLGNIDSPESRDMLRQLMTSGNSVVVRGALRGWAGLGDDEALQVLAKTLVDPGRDEDLRSQAALNLGKVKNPSAFQILVDSLNGQPDGDNAATILSGIGRRPYGETEAFFRLFLSRTDLSTDLRVAAVEALGHAEGDPSSLLLQHLKSESSAVRAAAAWALSMAENPVHFAPQLLRQLESERSTDVRTRIYQALENQSSVDWGSLQRTVLADSSASSRLAGLKLLAAQVSQQSNQAFSAEFDSVAVPQLENLAINGTELQNRMTSIIALKQAQTSGALQALHRITAQSADPRIVSAARVK